MQIALNGSTKLLAIFNKHAFTLDLLVKPQNFVFI